ncbi:MBL fold metallo-hydrolase [Kosmotoga pacifica]|uniref:Beta-lactamase n=1 Tax=Kosmotoga pacifica TaxID=1330330 RepID=A0A0G2ZDF1_9BACT|nr:MBL fold metallo-hydrolase [Kosmotoga pacifica]AKI98101.1 beta-lactamase [Kosmotoga pacifica]
MEFKIYSKALYSTWILYRPERLLFDVGESISSVLGNSVYAIKDVVLTHGHVDHIAGLWGLINTRNVAMGDRKKPLRIIFPRGNRAIQAYLDFIIGMNPRLRYEVILNPVDPNEEIFLRTAGNFKRWLVPFRVRHTPGEISYGYHIIEERKKLKAEFRSLDSNAIVELVKKHGREYITENFTKKVLTISGDSYALPPEIIDNSETLLHECTFLDGRDRKNQNHSTLEEIIENVKASNGIKRLILYHISGRYTTRIKRLSKDLIDKLEDRELEIHFVHPEKLFVL